MLNLYNYIIIASCIVLFSCGSDNKKPQEPIKDLKRFQFLSAKETGVFFNNQLSVAEQAEYFNYQYAINGSGVSLGDVNNDGLVDLYFVANARPNKLYINKGNMQFEDITEKAGLLEAEGNWSVGSTMVDINNDGFLDIYICMAGDKAVKSRKNLLYINNGDLTFTESANAYGIDDEGHSNQAVFFDYDLDDDLDLMVINHSGNWNERRPYKELDKRGVFSDKLFRNNGDATFTDVSEEAGLEKDRYGFGLGISVGDLNGDRYPDMYVANDYFGANYLYFNNGDGTFSEKIKEATKHISLFSMGTDIADYNNDGLLDIITVDMVAEDNYRQKTNMAGMNPTIFYEAVDEGLHYQYMFNTLHVNNGNESFSDVAQLAGLPNTDWSWAPIFADFDADGWKDLFITNGYARDLRNKDAIMKLVREGKIGKDKNGNTVYRISNIDHYSAFPEKKISNYAYRNNGDMTFEKVSYDWGINQSGFSKGASFADLDNDGDLDLVVNNLNALAWLYENQSEKMTDFNYLKLSLKGEGQNRGAIGSRVSLYTADGQQQTQELTLTRGYLSSVDPILTFGLGTHNRVEKIEVLYPNGKLLTLENISSNQLLVCDIADAQPTKITKANAQLFAEVSKSLGVDFKHTENDYDDFKKEVLLPHRNSQHGPGIAVGDVNNDGLEDFYIGGAANQSGMMYVQMDNGTFQATNQSFSKDKASEDMGAVFFDADNDGDADLYVVSGGNEFSPTSALLQDRLYLNNGSGVFTKSTQSLPTMITSGKEVSVNDFDADGDLDLFVGGRIIPGLYPFAPNSYVLQNNGGSFSNVTASVAPMLERPGLVTDSEWVDFDGDGQKDLIVVGEWMSVMMLQNNQGVFQDVSANYGMDRQTGWWYSIATADFDQDGDMDFVLGNNGLNYKYKATADQPFHIYVHDFDDSGSKDIVLGYFNQGTLYPVRGRQCSSEQIPNIKEKFGSYSSFGSADLRAVYGDKLDLALHYTVSNFATSYVENNGVDGFAIHNLPQEAQFSAVNGIVVEDVDADGINDLIMSGNLHVSEVETPRNDASIGLILKGNGDGTFVPLSVQQTGYYTPGDVKDVKLLKQGAKRLLLVANNDAPLQLLEF
ncbi:MAG: VCBS repeat-containing protein [Saprospiraceae bacterium]|nr:VCBS repeat-containing protein [Saprospiraceae bacterium]